MARPRIGVTAGLLKGELRLGVDYLAAVHAAGGVPVMLPCGLGCAAELFGAVRGLLLTGGPDVDPSLYGQAPHPALGRVDAARDQDELHLFRMARERRMPVLGICRGLQVMVAAGGGTLYQDLDSQLPGALRHRQSAAREEASHPIRVTEGSRLAELIGSGEQQVNSFHHQAVDYLPADWRAVARAPDGVLEGIEGENADFLLAVQWHPENRFRHVPTDLALFRGLVAAAAAWVE